MDDNEHDPKPQAAHDRPETRVHQDPSTNTSPPSNPPIDGEALEKGKEKLNSVVNW